MGDPLFAKDILAITEYSFSHVLRPEKGSIIFNAFHLEKKIKQYFVSHKKTIKF